MKYHFVGIKGVGMANLAVLLRLMGNEVQGSDVKGDFPTSSLLKKHKIKVYEGFSKENLKGVDSLIYTGAHRGIKNEEVVWAKLKGIPIFHLSEFIGQKILPEFKVKIAIAGTHGKTTTSSLVAWSLLKLGKNLGYLVGAPFFNRGIEGAGFRGKEFFVLEADEYAKSPPFDATPKFFEYKGLNFVLLPSLDFDHPDVYKDKEEIILAFEKFLALNPKAIVIYNREDPNLVEVIKRSKNKSFSYGRKASCDIRIGKVKFSSEAATFSLRFPKGEKEVFKIELFGFHNVLNSSAVVCLLYLLRHRPDEIKEALRGFFGASRRLEFKGKYEGKLIFDDYAHHPKEIEVTLQALKKAFPKKKILIIFQPHTFSRTEALKDQFISALSKADFAVLLPIFPSAREKNSARKISSMDLVEGIRRKGGKAELASSFKKAAELAKKVEDVDIILTAGAGDVYKCLDYLND